MKRLFVALHIEPHEELLETFSFIKSQLASEHINWVDMANFHLTLKFIGETDDLQSNEIIKRLKQIQSIAPFTFTLEGLKIFKDIADPRVLFVNVRNNFEPRQLSTEINNRLSEIGILPEKNGFKPHITLGRIKFIKDKDALDQLLFDFRNHYFQSVHCTEFVLFESQLTPKGPIYKQLAKYPLS
jgi:RNA 2',3'-cyclic 3'-phosphodiesterase